MRNLGSALLLLLCLALVACEPTESDPLPNIVIIYADDMGYGDLGIQNPDSKIPTPNLDRLAASGMRFTDAHSSSGICSPSRFALLTGMYHWRRQHDIVNSFGPPFFREGDVTLPQLLRDEGYATACIGKWHLGWDWDFLNEPSGLVTQWNRQRQYYLPGDIDWSRPVSGGPLDRGFDSYYGDGTINFPPYAWVENDSFLQPPLEVMDIDSIGYTIKEGRWEFRPGPKVAGWNPYEVLPTLTSRTVEWIGERTEDRPFFLYFALPSPHAPIIPNDAFDGTSGAGAYGDFVVQTDWVVGQVLEAIRHRGLADNTLVIFSSDNGPEAYAWERAERYGHFSMGDFRGLKRDVWEGGHHVPLLISWPKHVEEGSVSDQLVSQIDLMATLADVVGAELPAGAAPDSHDFSSILRGERTDSTGRDVLVHNTFASKWGIRKGEWLYIDDSTGGHRALPGSFAEVMDYTDFTTPGILFHYGDDPGQRTNLYAEYPEKVAELDALLRAYRKPEPTTPVDR